MKAEALAQQLQIHSEALNEAWTNMMDFEIKFSSEGSFFPTLCRTAKCVKEQQ